MNEIMNNSNLVELSVNDLICVNGGNFSDGYKAGHDAAKPIHDTLSGLGILTLIYAILVA